MKTCTKCGETKPLEEFYRDRGRRRSACKGCDVKRNAEYYAAHRDAVRAAVKAWQAANPEWVREYAASDQRRAANRRRQAEYDAGSRGRSWRVLRDARQAVQRFTERAEGMYA